MGNYNYKCGSCGKLVKPVHLFTTDNRYVCPVCGPLCKDCTDIGIISSNKCKNCEHDNLERQEISNGRWG